MIFFWRKLRRLTIEFGINSSLNWEEQSNWLLRFDIRETKNWLLTFSHQNEKPRNFLQNFEAIV